MSRLKCPPAALPAAPPELRRLRDRIAAEPGLLRSELLALADEAVESAAFRDRILAVARDGLERYRVELAAARHDLESTRREHETLRRLLGATS